MMGKFTDLEKDVFSVFDGVAWKAENILTVPSNFLGSEMGTEFISVSVIASGASPNTRSISGVCLVDIFIAAGGGPRRASIIADKLDSYLVGKTIPSVVNGVTQFFASSLAHKGVDKANPSLHRSTYTVTFNHFGAF